MALDEMFEVFGITRSLSKKGCPYGNAVVESTNKILKAEFVYRERFGSLEELQIKLSEYRSSDGEGGLCHHTHAALAYKDGDEHRMAAGHVKSITVLYTAEIELRPVRGGTIAKQYDPETGTGFWRFPK